MNNSLCAFRNIKKVAKFKKTLFVDNKNNKMFFIFYLNSSNKFVENLIIKLNEIFGSYFFILEKSKKGFFMGVSIHLENYIFFKNELYFELVYEKLKFSFVGIKQNKNFVSIDFFENNFFETEDSKETYLIDVLYNCFCLLKVTALKLFIVLNSIIINLFSNVNNTSSRI